MAVSESKVLTVRQFAALVNQNPGHISRQLGKGVITSLTVAGAREYVARPKATKSAKTEGFKNYTVSLDAAGLAMVKDAGYTVVDPGVAAKVAREKADAKAAAEIKAMGLSL